jgi:hypothetical protein
MALDQTIRFPSHILLLVEIDTDNLGAAS